MTARLFINRAAQILCHGGVIAYPTEAVFGLGCNPLAKDAVLRILAMKRRSINKGLILVACSFAQLKPFVGALSQAQITKLGNSWPGPVTWIVPAHSSVPYWITGEHDTVAIRVTAHPTAKALCLQADMPLVSTSANIAALPASKTRLATQLRFGLDVDFIVPGKVGDQKRPTEIRDLISNQIVRVG